MTNYPEFRKHFEDHLRNLIKANPMHLSIILDFGSETQRNYVLPIFMSLMPNPFCQSFFIFSKDLTFRMTNSRICLTQKGLRALSERLSCGKYLIGTTQIVIDVSQDLTNIIKLSATKTPIVTDRN